jgi:hypothetical protein
VLDIFNIPVQRRETAEPGKTYRKHFKTLFPAAETVNYASALSSALVDRIAHVECLFIVVYHLLPILARRWRLVHDIARLGSAHKAA